MKLNKKEIKAVEVGSSDEILDVGASYYLDEKYEKAIEYYRIAASMNNAQAIANLGYCYMYGRGVNVNKDLALVYFMIAARQNNLDALYKMGTFYYSGDGVVKDEKKALKYLNRVLKTVDEDCKEEYPSLYFTLAKIYIDGTAVEKNIKKAYKYLKIAEIGYEYQIKCGMNYYEKQLKEVKKLLNDKTFND